MTQAAVAHETCIPFVTTCPRCGNEQTQWYSLLALLTVLWRGQPVESYCVVCHEFWQLGTHEQNTLAAKLAGSRSPGACIADRGQGRPCSAAGALGL